MEIDALLEHLAWAERPLRLGVDVLAAGPEGYGARVRVLDGTSLPSKPGAEVPGPAAEGQIRPKPEPGGPMAHL